MSLTISMVPLITNEMLLTINVSLKTNVSLLTINMVSLITDIITDYQCDITDLKCETANSK